MRFKDKVAIISGGGSTGPGISAGRAASIKFAAEGARVVVVDKNLPSAEETVKMIKDEGGEAIAVETDVLKEADVRNMVKKTLATYGRIDILFNNVGMAWGTDLVDTSEDIWHKTIDINIKSIFIVSKCVVPEMRKTGGGVIINNSSHNSINHSGCYAYSCAKAAVNKLTQDMAYDYGRDNIRVNCVLPGSIDSPLIHATLNEEQRAQRTKRAQERIPLGREGKPEEIANVVLFFASDDASFCNGACLLVDGGQNCR